MCVMKIAVIGAGAIGSVVAAYLSKEGVDITLIGRNEQVEAIKKNGLKVSGVRGQETFNVEILPQLDYEPDLAIFTVKTQDLEQAYEQNNKYLDNSLVVSSQNGVQADNILGGHFERESVLSSIVMFGATCLRPAEVVFNFEGKWIIGRAFMPVSPKVHEVAGILKKGFDVVVSENIIGMKWLKLFINFNNCLPALIGKSMQDTFSDMDFCRLSIFLLREGVEIVKKAKIEVVSLPDFPKERIFGLVNMPVDQAAGIINKTLTGLSNEPLYGSILQSIMRGRVSEIDFINGEVVCLARQIREQAPLNSKVVDMVHHVEETGRFFSPEEVKEAFKRDISVNR